MEKVFACGRARSSLVILALFAAGGGSVHAAPPRLYHSSGLQSPVQAAGDDLLLLAGDGFADGDRAAYRELAGDSDAWPANAALPAASDARTGVAAVIDEVSDTSAMVIHLPRDFDARRAYALAVVNAAGEWSNRVFINEPRAYWLTPGWIPASGSRPGLGRKLKVVGRNLANDGGTRMQVRLRGTQEFLLRADAARAPGLDQYALEVSLPAVLPAGQYRVAVSRDGRYWSESPMPLQVRAALPVSPEFAVGDARFGGCRPDDAEDDTRCVIAALAAAGAVRGTVRFTPGTWRIDAPESRGVVPGEGICVPRGVTLAGDPASESRIERSDRWNARGAPTLFLLPGDNVVRDLNFVDTSTNHDPKAPSEFLQLGRDWMLPMPKSQRLVDNVAIVGNRFHGADVAIRDSGLALRDLVISGNRIGARIIGLGFGGDGNNVAEQFRIDEAVITQNVFEPGSYIDPAIRQGARATEFGAGSHFDFSDNFADGASLAALDSPADPPGWRAAFFWHLRGPQEQLLIANNRMTCTGDKLGDGEAIALDNNHNWGGFETARNVLAADAESVTVLGAPVGKRENKAVDPANYYVGYWIAIADGTGTGQTRRVTALNFDAKTLKTTLRVAPAWDVAPLPGKSRVTLARVFWQTFIIANTVDNRRPTCRKSNRTEPEGGSIAVWAQSSDSVVANNHQFDTDGVVFHQTYGPGAASFNSFLEIRDNEIRGEYDASKQASQSGIRGPHGTAPDTAPVVESFGVSIAHNLIDAADGPGGAGISIPLAWYDGPAPHGWPLIDRLLVFHNSIANTRVAVSIESRAQVRGAVLYGNHCADTRLGVEVSRLRALALCPTPPDDSCECRGVH